MLFKSAVDWWYYLVLIATIIVLLVAVIPTVSSGQISTLSTLGIFLLSLGLPLWLLLSTNYQVSGSFLIIKSGPFSWRIRLAEVESVKPSRSALSSPALSLNHIEIRYSGGKRILVSPANKEGFLEAIGQSGNVT